jgi:hypothetical protein
MAARTWIGGGNNQASNAKDWSPHGAPAAGDTLTLAAASATIKVADNDLAGDTLAITGNGDTVNLSNATATVTLQNVSTGTGGPLTAGTLNLKGTDDLTFSELLGNNPNYPTAGDGGSKATINLANNTTWNGTFNASRTEDVHNGFAGSTLTINGPSHAQFDNDGSSIVGDIAVINTHVIGQGSFTSGFINMNSPLSTLEFGNAVDAGQAIKLNYTKLIIDHPNEFLASVALDSGGSVIDLNDLVKANSYSFHNDMLTIYGQNGKAIDTLRLSSTEAFSVEKTPTGMVSIYTAFSQPPAGTLLPLHI